jgi:hypothetical protein
VRAEVRPELRAADKTRLAQEDESNRQAEQTKAQILAARAAARRERREQEVRQHAEKRRRERELAEKVRQDEERKQRDEERKQRDEERKRRAEEMKRQEEARKQQEEARKRQAEEMGQRARENNVRYEAKQRHERNAQQPLSAAWATFESFFPDLEKHEKFPTDLEIYTMDFWPTRVGSYSSCNVASVREFFAYRFASFDRKAMRNHARVWHPDRAMLLFVNAIDKETLLEKVNMVSAIVNGFVGAYK